jgi:hypothetical protein
MTRIATFACMLATAATIAGCAWVRPDPGADRVHVRSAAEARNCERLGTVGTSITARFGPVPRHQRRVAEELETLARNEALSMNGNTIVPMGVPVEGRQNFEVYRCRLG